METSRRTYKDILRNELADRIAANPSYSLRAMARQLKIAPSLLSDVLNGKKKFSPTRALEIAQALNFDYQRTEYFTALVQLESAKSPQVKALLQAKIESLDSRSSFFDLDLEIFKTISEWYHFAVLELTHVAGFSINAHAVSDKLKISIHEAEAAIQRLLRVGLLGTDEKGKLKKTKSLVLAKSKIPNQALRSYHEQTMKKAIAALSEQTPNEKFVASETFAFSAGQLDEASEIIKECMSRIVNLAGAQKEKGEVYHLGVQFFRMTQLQKGDK